MLLCNLFHYFHLTNHQSCVRKFLSHQIASAFSVISCVPYSFIHCLNYSIRANEKNTELTFFSQFININYNTVRLSRSCWFYFSYTYVITTVDANDPVIATQACYWRIRYVSWRKAQIWKIMKISVTVSQRDGESCNVHREQSLDVCLNAIKSLECLIK